MKNLQKGFIVPLLITIISVLVIGGVYVYSQNKAPQNTITNFDKGMNTATSSVVETDSQTTQASSSASIVSLENTKQIATSSVEIGTINDMFSVGKDKDYFCSYDEVIDREKFGEGKQLIKNNIYISKDRIHEDIITEIQGAKGVHVDDSHFLINKDDVYIWQGDAIGRKYTTQMFFANMNSNVKMAYNCSPWQKDNSKFLIPTSIAFSSFVPIPKNIKNGNVQNLISNGKDLMCNLGRIVPSEFNEKENVYGLSGVLYVSGKKARYDALGINSNYSSMESDYAHSIIDGDTIYVWSGKDNKGTRDVTGMLKGEALLNNKFDYTCSPWKKDESVFTPPSNIKFTDINWGDMKG